MSMHRIVSPSTGAGGRGPGNSFRPQILGTPGLDFETEESALNEARVRGLHSPVPKCEGVQFHDMVYTLSPEMVYISARG